ncbi:HDIG domain-containing metalloprotein [Pannus brasiliensis CCIBt3594]|uniref:HDIG domain-containing metalloprotein n=1 Tax=Pannus brasiliensis CCIBt3594 TaxID=1427578 RepID=A0AAW9QWX7_9CHRO
MGLFLSTPATSPYRDRKPLSVPLARTRRPIIFLFTVGCLTSVVGYRFYNQPKLAMGTFSPTTIIAPKTASFEDRDTTEARRQKIRAGLIPVLKRDAEMTASIERDLSLTLDRLDLSRQIGKNFPTDGARSLSPATLQYLTTTSEAIWSSLSSPSIESESDPEIPTAIASEVDRYRQRLGPQRWQKLVVSLDRVRREFPSSVREAADSPELEPSALAVNAAGRGSARDWNESKRQILGIARVILAQGIPPGLAESHLREAIDLQIRERVPLSGRLLARELLESALIGKSNLVEDETATRQQAAKAIEAVETVLASVEEGQVIVRAGEKIDRADFVVLDGFGLSERGMDWTGLAGTALLVTGAIGTFCLVARRLHRPLRHRDFLLLGLLTLTPPILAIANFPFTNLAAVGLLTGSFYGPTLAVTQVLLTSGLSMFGINRVSIDLVAGTVGGLVAALVAGRLRSRDEFSLLGIGIGITQSGVYLLGYLLVSATTGTVLLTILPHAVVYGLSGLAWTVVALGISPLLERFFDVVTPIRLVELANPNRDLLKRLATEAPGTFQHTLFVACLAEAAARELHCNVELIRAGTLYHDIGKMHDALGFIENQMGGPNKHDRIDDPYISAEIIKKHVTEGLVMARKYGLPRAVRDFIPEHQGTLLISYFYHQAKQRAESQGKEPVSEADFRYDGPIPQSRETGIVMLADSTEAALRSMKDATPEQAMDTIKKIFQARWRDNQLADSGLRLEELPIIAEIFVRVWQQFHHRRIAYPKAVLEARPTDKTSV